MIIRWMFSLPSMFAVLFYFSYYFFKREKLVLLYKAAIKANPSWFVMCFHYLSWRTLFVAMQCVTTNTARHSSVHPHYTSYYEWSILL